MRVQRRVIFSFKIMRIVCYPSQFRLEFMWSFTIQNVALYVVAYKVQCKHTTRVRMKAIDSKEVGWTQSNDITTTSPEIPQLTKQKIAMSSLKSDSNKFTLFYYHKRNIK